MNKNELQNYIENNIPIVQKMGFSINEIGDDKVIVSGEYCTHINHTNSVFGGSISSIMTLAGWTRVKILSEEIDPSSTVIIQNNSTNFIKPVTEDYQVYTEKIELTEIKKLKKSIINLEEVELRLLLI